MNTKLKKIGSNVLWVISLCIFLAQGYRAVAYYIFDKPIEWNWQDIAVFCVAFLAMFVPSKLKTLVVNTATRITNKK